MSWDQFLATCEEDLRAGRTDRVVKRLQSLNTAKIPRSFASPIASLCHRTEQISQGLRILGPIVLADRKLKSATPVEITEYSALLRRYGAVREALKKLKTVDPTVVPQSLLYQAFCHFNLWQYEEAITCLEKYLKLPLAPYALSVAKVNLLSALIVLKRSKEAFALADEEVRLNQEKGYTRLLANCLEMRAQIHADQGSLPQARESLEQAAGILAQGNLPDSSFVKKWLAILEARETKSVDPLVAFRQDALVHRHWEGVREADLYILKINFDAEAFDYLYCGTPHEGYRRRMAGEIGHECTREELFMGSGKGYSIDLETGEVVGLESLIAGGKFHRAISALLKDFYRPPNIGALFSDIFPDEFFDIHSSPLRVHQIMRRVRRWAEAAKAPLEVTGHKGLYSLKLGGGIQVRIPVERPVAAWEEAHLARLEKHFGNGRFNPRAVREALGLSLDQAKRLTKWGVENGILSRHGSGPATSYEIIGKEDMELKAA